MVNHHHSHPDPDVALAINSSRENLRTIAAKCLPNFKPDPNSVPSHAAPLGADKERELLFQLCEQEHWEMALPLAANQFVSNSQDPVTTYLLATCLQRLKQSDQALGLFGLCTQLEGDQPSPGPIFRGGECLAALGQTQKAQEAFETAIELARGHHEHAEILGLAEDKLAALQANT